MVPMEYCNLYLFSRPRLTSSCSVNSIFFVFQIFGHIVADKTQNQILAKRDTYQQQPMFSLREPSVFCSPNFAIKIYSRIVEWDCKNIYNVNSLYKEWRWFCRLFRFYLVINVRKSKLTRLPRQVGAFINKPSG